MSEAPGESAEQEPDVPTEEALADDLFHRWLQGPRDSASAAALLASQPEGVCRAFEDSLRAMEATTRALGGLQAGDRLGRYRVRTRLASTNMGEVWVASDEGPLGRSVALKVLDAESSLDPEAHLRFLRGARAQALVDHPNVAKVLDLGFEDPHAFIVQELVENGRTLQHRLNEGPDPRSRGPADTEQWIRLFLEVIHGLDAAHRSGVIHRDIKPSNILLTPEDHPLLCDFGLAQVSIDPSLTRTHQMLGTPSYMAPEQASRRRGRVDERTDVYGLGATLYEVLAGRPPFSDADLAGLAKQVQHSPPLRPDLICPTVPGPLADCCMRALEKRPSLRYPTVRAMGADLEQYLEGSPARRYATPRSERLRLWTLRRPFASSGVLLLTLLVAWLVRDAVLGWQSDLEFARRFESSVAAHRLGELGELHRSLSPRAAGVVSTAEGLRWIRVLEDPPLDPARASLIEIVDSRGRADAVEWAARWIDRAGYREYPEFVGYIGLSLGATQGPEFERIASTVALLGLGRPPILQDERLAAEPIVQALRSLDIGSSPLVLSALANFGQPRDLPSILEFTQGRLATSIGYRNAEWLRLALQAFEGILRNEHRAGLTSMPTLEEHGAWMEDLHGSLLRVAPEDPGRSYDEPARNLYLTEALLRRALGWVPFEGVLPWESGIVADPVRIARGDLDELHRLETDSHRFETHLLESGGPEYLADQLGFLHGVGGAGSVTGVQQARLQRIAEQNGIPGSDPLLPMFEEGKTRGHRRTRGLWDALQPDPESRLSWPLDHPSPQWSEIPLAQGGDEKLIEKAIDFHWEIRGKGPRSLRPDLCRLWVRDTGMYEAEHLSGFHDVRLASPGRSAVRLEFENRPFARYRDRAMQLFVEVQKGCRAALPGRGSPAVQVRIDGRLICDRLVVRANSTLVLAFDVESLDSLGVGTHEFEILLHPLSDTTLRFYRAYLGHR